tara:strand:+ start:210 stop:500 length:291 start_codon:yes stop_codon:yes gene_type:complete
MAKESIPKILHKHVSIRRSGRVLRNVLTQSLVSNIKQGKLQKDDEISADEKIWVRLDQHYQLSDYFPTQKLSSSQDLPPDMEKHLFELSKMLKDLS